MQEIIDHDVDGTQVTQQYAFITTTSSTRWQQQTSKGCDIVVQWKDGSSTWVSLSDIQESHPVQLAKYSVQDNCQWNQHLLGGYHMS